MKPGARSKTRSKAWSKLSIALLFYICALLFAAAPAQAQSPLSPELQQEILGLGQQAAAIGLGERALADVDLRLYAVRIVRGALAMVGILVLAMIVYGGFMYMTSGGNEEKVTKARTIIVRTVIGLALVLSSYGIVMFVSRKVSRAIFEQAFIQRQSCATTNGVAECCREWRAFQEAGSAFPTSAAEIAANQRAQREAYREWQDCQGRERESVERAVRGIRGGN